MPAKLFLRDISPFLKIVDFPAMVWTSDHLSTAGDGVYSIDHAPPLHLPSSNPLPTDTAVRSYLSSLVASRKTWVPPRTFSPNGMEYSVKMYGGKHASGAWFAPELIVHYEPDYNAEVFKKINRETGKRYVGDSPPGSTYLDSFSPGT